MSTHQLQPISVFYIPKDLISAFSPADQPSDVARLESQPPSNLETYALENLQIQQETDRDKEALACNTCGIEFPLHDRTEHRKHFATDWHRYNVKRRLVLGAPPVTQPEFEDLLAGIYFSVDSWDDINMILHVIDLSDSLSGSGSEDSDDEEDRRDNDKIATLVGKQQMQDSVVADLIQQATSDLQLSPLQRKYSALTWYTASNLYPASLHFGLYRNLFTSLDDNCKIEKLQAEQYLGKPRIWTVLLMGGGHFAGAVLDITKSPGVAETRHEKQMKMLEHKTFHRYTTRRKQGGAQSANDNAKGNANSAGAQIRRHNEQQLQQEIREVLSQWKKYIDASELVLVHAPSSNKKIIYGYNEAILRKDDPRLRSIPFSTRRPTLNEVKRVFLEITTVKVLEMDADVLQEHQQKLAAKEEKIRQQLEKSRSKKESSPVATRENAKRQISSETEKLVLLIKQGKTQVVTAYINNHPDVPVSSSLPEDVQAEDTLRLPSVLHIASNYGHPELVSQLIREYNADPTIKNRIGKTAYEVAKNKETRNAFRRCMCDLPNQWNWLQEAHVPSPLTKEAEAQLMEKERQKQQKEEERKRLIEEERCKKEEAHQREMEAEAAAAANARKKPQKLDPIAKALLGSSHAVNTANMSPEARMRLEREKRARAAEERLRRLQGR
ncbi:uncharacterized protein BYT42DRAFT_591877 [Radiomyces spectabilis]|uniref:uncharacterized protein n=1 Tax=Radiomyces spectabilis TaxID=64574 RepID=UPI00221FDEE0|nr:uncharacterized protein BYT42DRAFT_591877 [Radiomyces spectabilis]KAI8391286.1 hypothetical protein BYT42DRAFT_591877 [Radiomyces spectabilis]